MATYPIIKPQDVLGDCVYTVLQASYCDSYTLFWLQICRCPIVVASYAIKGSFILSNPAQFLTAHLRYSSPRF